MSGKFEKERDLERKIKNRLEDMPPIMTEYYYSLVGSGKSYDTAYKYIGNVILFYEFISNGMYNETFYKDIKSTHINKYITSLRTKSINGKMERTSDSMKTVHWSALNSFFQFLVPEYIKDNPVANTQRPKMKDNPQVTYLTPEEISKILQNIECNSIDRFKNRDLCLLKLGFSTGLRVSAIIQIDIDDIDFTHNQIRVTEKGDYDNYIMFGDNLKKQLLAWMEDRKRYFGNSASNALFISARNQRLSDDMVARVVKKYAVGVTDKHITPHVMRHSCATNLYEKTGDIYLCAKQLNNKYISRVQRYCKLSEEKRATAVELLDDMI